jgi:hypothetical protein
MCSGGRQKKQCITHPSIHSASGTNITARAHSALRLKFINVIDAMVIFVLHMRGCDGLRLGVKKLTLQKIILAITARHE